jgi:hypothetical protein
MHHSFKHALQVTAGRNILSSKRTTSNTIVSQEVLALPRQPTKSIASVHGLAKKLTVIDKALKGFETMRNHVPSKLLGPSAATRYTPPSTAGPSAAYSAVD